MPADRMPGERESEAERAAATRPPTGGSSSLAEPRPEGVFLEIQLHPAAVERGVHCWFLGRRQVAWGLAALSLYLLFLLCGAALAPWALAGLLRAVEYDGLLGARRLHGEHLQSLVAALDELGGATEALELEMERIYLAYGLGEGDLTGQGGYPFAAGSPGEAAIESGRVESGIPAGSIYSGLVEHGRGRRAAIGERLAVVETFLEEIDAFEAAHRDQVALTPSRSPLERSSFVLTSPFGTRRSPFTKKLDFHAGIDLAAARGTPIRAPADGEVVFAGRYQLRLGVAWWRYGNLVALRHGDRYVTLYGHCEEILVRVGQEVAQGEVIATVGDSGWSTSPHLHYEVRLVDDESYRPVDPRIYILDHRWRDEEQILVRARSAPAPADFDPLPRAIRR